MSRSFRRAGRRALVAAMAAALLAGIAGAAPVDARIGQDDGSDAALSWSVEPDPTGIAGERTNFSFVAGPGETITDTVRITNLGSTPLELDLYAADAVLIDRGRIDMTGADVDPEGVGVWIDLPEDSLVVPVGEGVDVPFELVVPDDAAPGDRTGGIVTSLSTESVDESGRDVTAEMRLVSRVQVRVTGTVETALEVSDLTIDFHGSGNPFSSGSATVSYVVTNTGNVRAGAEQVVRLRGLFGLTGREAALDDLPELHPGASIPVELEIDGVWPTVRTTAEVALRPRVGAVGDGEGLLADEVTTTSTSVFTFPWPQLLLIAAIALGWWWKRRRDRRRIDRAVAAAVADRDTTVGV